MRGLSLRIAFAGSAFLTGVMGDAWLGNTPDQWIHDAAVVYRGRTSWPHVAIVALDSGVPMQVGRRQALPLFARAAERLIGAGVPGVFLDARLAREQEPAMPYATCLESDGRVRWSIPRCIASDQARCQLSGSPAGAAPLRMNLATLKKFRIAPYLPGQENLPDFLLFGEAALYLDRPPVAADRLVSQDSAVMRWLDLSPDHAAVQLAMLIDPGRTSRSLKQTANDELCHERTCRRIRLAPPLYRIQMEGGRLVVPLSLLASCDPQIARPVASKLRGKAVILQMTQPDEASDLIVTPMTTAWWGPHSPTPGAQYLADAVETLLLQDHPRAPPPAVKWLLFAVVAVISVVIGFRWQLVWLWGLAPALAVILTALCFLNPQVQLWPVTATLAVYVTAAAQVTGLFLVVGLREGYLIRRYMPRQVHDLLLFRSRGRQFRDRRYPVVVLMSDLANYTTVTGLLGDPALVLALMNDYLEETSLVLQEKYQGWLESYVGDMACYYWPVWGSDADQAYANALRGAVELARLQQRFFATVPQRYRDRLPQTLLQRLATVIDAGVGLATGTAVMGDLGPRHGVRRFGILGDPLNLAARLESLTRHFDSHILIHGELVVHAGRLGLKTRRLGRFRVKGRTAPVTVFALGTSGEEAFAVQTVRRWEDWLSGVEQDRRPEVSCPLIYSRDRATLEGWRRRGLLRDGIWHLEEK